MKPIYLAPNATVLITPMKEEPDCVVSATEAYIGDKLITLPYRPGETCYSREAWRLIFCGGSAGDGQEESSYEIHYKDGTIRKIEWKGKINTDPYVKYLDMQEGYPGSLPAWNSPALMPELLARHFFTVVSCEAVRVKEVTEQDAVKTGLFGSPITRDCKLPKFRRWWQSKHPGKEWAWLTRVEDIGEGRMQKEIKFRAWDKEHNKMLYDIARLHFNEGRLYAVMMWDGSVLIKDDTFDLMQFTGKKDIRGNEVYQDDKVTWMHRGSVIEGVVYWSDYGWMVKDTRGGNATRLGNVRIIEVVGNIHEKGKIE